MSRGGEPPRKGAQSNMDSTDKPEDPESPDQPGEEQPSGPARAAGPKSGAAARRQRERSGDIRLAMMRSIVTEPLLGEVTDAVRAESKAGAKAKELPTFDVIIALNETYRLGIDAAREAVEKRATQWGVATTSVPQYVFARMTAWQILDLASEAHAQMKVDRRTESLIYRIWEDADFSTTLTHSLVTVKADAAQRAFQALGDGIVWAVLDSGIQGDHAHFTGDTVRLGPIRTLDVPAPLMHRDFTPDGAANGAGGTAASDATALQDRLGHGTHVSGIIAGCWEAQNPDGEKVIGVELRDESTDNSIPTRESLKFISGVAPKAKLLSLKVIADVTRTDAARQTIGQGKVSWVLMAIDHIQTWNQNGRRHLIHGVNMSLGYDFDPRWFGCGQSPICVEINRLVRSGVAVVVSAGNGGYSTLVTASGTAQTMYTDLSITDPGNAELAITVGATHREMPHTYGVSYFSSRGPTGDGRLKPDLLAPGERIISCAAGLEAAKYGSKDEEGKEAGPVRYCELSGTSMAAPHVSGAVAAFLSVRGEFIGEPERVKQIFQDNAIDLRRERTFQGAGLLDLMKVLQAV